MSLSVNEQIAYLNSVVKVKIGPSKIHGVGIIAIVAIKKGQRLYLKPNLNPQWFTLSLSNLSKLYPEVKELILQQWASVVNGSHFLAPNDSCWMILYMNHGEGEDENYDVATDMAIKDIPKGMEVFENYKRMDNA